MKKLFFKAMFGLFLYFPSAVSAQSEQDMHEVRLQLSDGIPLAIVNAFSIGLADSFGAAFQGYNIEREGTGNLSGVWSIGYRHYIGPRFNIGGDVSYMRNASDYTLSKDGDVRQGERRTNFIMAMPTGEYIYMNKAKVQLYGNAAVGILMLKGHSTVTGDRYDYDATTLAFQINPIGVRFGQRVGGFAELGFGLKGILTAGLSVRL